MTIIAINKYFPHVLPITASGCSLPSLILSQIIAMQKINPTAISTLFTLYLRES